MFSRIFDQKKRRVPNYIELKTPEIRFTVILSPFNLLLLNKHFFLAVSVPYVHMNTLNYALIFYPVMYILVNLSITGPIHTYPDIF